MTDATVYNTSRDVDQTDIKKRKRGLDGEVINGYNVDESAGSGAIYTGHVRTNGHLRTIHAELKAEYEELGSYCVSFPPMSGPRYAADNRPGKTQVVGQSDDAQVSLVLFIRVLRLTGSLGLKSKWLLLEKSGSADPVIISSGDNFGRLRATR